MRHSQKQTSESEYDGFPIQRAEPSDRSPRGLRPVGDAPSRRNGVCGLVRTRAGVAGNLHRAGRHDIGVPQADAALYTAKGGGRNRLDFASIRL